MEFSIPAKLFNVMNNEALQWIDNIVINATDVQNLVISLMRFGKAVIYEAVRLNRRKCSLFNIQFN